MICHRYRVIFIHQRKCAGSSIKKMFGVAGDDATLLQDGLLDKNWGRLESVRREYLSFCVVRNPWDKFVSAWKYLAATRDRDIKDVLRHLPQASGDKQERHDYRHISRQQSDLIYDKNDEIAVDRVLRFENLENDIRGLAAEVGFEVNELPRVNANRSAGDDYRKFFYDEECLSLFGERFGRDIRLLGYAF